MSSSNVVVLAGGTGGAKLARGMLDVVGPDELVVIANTGDDIDVYGARVSPDPDLISFWLADEIDERGWGLAGDTFTVMDALRALGRDVWFNLGDRDLAWCLRRRELEEEGLRATEALARLNETIGVRARVLPMCDEPLRTFVNGMPLQEFLIRARGEGPVRDIAVHGREGVDSEPAPTPTPEVLAALASARAVIVGPSNPVISIWPILLVLGDALAGVRAPVVCVSPIVGGRVLKGPTAAFLDAWHLPCTAAGVLAYYESVATGLLDGIVADEPVPAGSPWGSERPRFVGSEMSVPSGVATLRIDTAMPDAAARARVAEATLSFALSLGS